MTSQQTSPSAPEAGDWVTRWLSSARFAVYMASAGSDKQLALDLYEWNAEISSAVLHDLAHVEVGLRNAYNTALEQYGTFPRHWTLCADQVFAPLIRTKKRWDSKVERKVNVKVDVNKKPRDSLTWAVRQAGGDGSAPGKIVAELMFGFWRYLSSSAHDVSLWRPYLHHAFPAGTSRPYVDERIGKLHDLRNRVAHHEPLLAEDLRGQHQVLLELADLIQPELAGHISITTRVPDLIASRPVG